MENTLFNLISIIIIISALGIVLFNKHLYIVIGFLVCILSTNFLFLLMKNLNLFLFLFIPLPVIISGLILIGIGGGEDSFLDWKKDLPRISIALIISILILSSLIFLNDKNRLEPSRISEVQTTSMAKIGEILFTEHMIPVVVIFIYFFIFFIGVYFVSKIGM